MSESLFTALVASNVVLWVVVVVLSIALLALVRQVGVLHERIAPAGAMLQGNSVKVGERAPELSVHDLDGNPVRVGGIDPDGRSTLLFFLSPTCPVCATLLPTLLVTAREEDATTRLVLASDGAGEGHRGYVAEHKLEAWPYVVSSDLGLAYQVARLPYCVLIDSGGVVRAAGMVNTREHVESLFEARERGVATIQDYLTREATSAALAAKDSRVG